MEWQQLITDGYERVLQALEKALDGLTESDLNQQPHPDCNSIGWLTWHLTRTQDHHIASLMGEEQLWIEDGWHAKFNSAPDARDTGYQHNSQDVAAFRSPNLKTLLEYHRVVLDRSKCYITSLSENDLDREVNEPWVRPQPTVGAGLVCALDDNLQHAGQVAYLRGLLKGKGWSTI